MRVLSDERIADLAAADAGLPDARLLGDFPQMLRAAASGRRRLRAGERSQCAAGGAQAATEGVAARALVDLYLSLAWRLWRDGEPIGHDPREAALWVLRAVDDGVAALIEGMQLARADLVRMQESARHEVVEGLLAGGRQAAAVSERAEQLGLPLTGPVLVLLADRPSRLDDPDLIGLPGDVEAALTGRHGDTTALVLLREGRLVTLASAPDGQARHQVTEAVDSVLSRRLGPSGPAGTGWLIAVSTPRTGAGAVRSSYLEALEGIDLGRRANLPGPVVHSEDLTIYRVLMRDNEAAWQLVLSTLDGLRGARGGGAELLHTLATYLDAGGNATLTAARLHLSVRAVTYRLNRVAELIGRDPGDLTERLTLHAAVTAARLLDWPRTEGPGSAG